METADAEQMNNIQLLTIVTKNSVLYVVGILALSLHSGQTIFTFPHLIKYPIPIKFFFLSSPFLTYLILALIKLGYLLLTDNKLSIYFDDWIKKFRSKIVMDNWYLPYFRNENEDCNRSCLSSLII